MPLEGEYEPSSWDWVREQVEEYEASGGQRANTFADTGLPIIVMTNRGHKSGKLRKTPLIRVTDGTSYAVIGSMGGAPTAPQWVHNLQANPQVELQDGAVKADYTARQLEGDEKAAWWARATEVWPDYDTYQASTERIIPLFVLEP